MPFLTLRDIRFPRHWGFKLSPGRLFHLDLEPQIKSRIRNLHDNYTASQARRPVLKSFLTKCYLYFIFTCLGTELVNIFWRHSVCSRFNVSIFWVALRLLPCIGRGLADGRSPVQGVLSKFLQEIIVSEVNSHVEHAGWPNPWNVQASKQTNKQTKRRKNK
jgi:hypothetical protein